MPDTERRTALRAGLDQLLSRTAELGARPDLDEATEEDLRRATGDFTMALRHLDEPVSPDISQPEKGRLDLVAGILQLGMMWMSRVERDVGVVDSGRTIL